LKRAIYCLLNIELTKHQNHIQSGQADARSSYLMVGVRKLDEVYNNPFNSSVTYLNQDCYH